MTAALRDRVGQVDEVLRDLAEEGHDRELRRVLRYAQLLRAKAKGELNDKEDKAIGEAGAILAAGFLADEPGWDEA